VSRGRLIAAALALCGLLLAAAPAAAPARTAYVTGNIEAQLAEGIVRPVDLATQLLGTTIHLGGEGSPPAVAITPDGTRAYVPVGDEVIPIDVATNSRGTAIPVGAGAAGIAITPDGTRAYVAERFPSSVTPIDLATATAGTPIPVGSEASAIAITPDGTRAYVANRGDDNVSVIDLASNAVVGTIPVGTAPDAVAVNPNGTRAYVANYGSDNVSVIDLASNAVVGTISVGEHPQAIAVTPDGTRAYVLGLNNPVTPIDLGSGAAGTPIEVEGHYLGGLAILPDGSRAYLTDETADGLVPVNVPADTLGAGFPASEDSRAIAIVPNQGPHASFAASPQPAAPGQTIGFDGGASSDSDGTVVRYDWDFGDGTGAANGGPTPGHAYAAAGAYTVTLTVTDDEGCSTSIVFPGQTAYCNGSAAARTTRTVTVVAPGTEASGGGAAVTTAAPAKKRKRCPKLRATATSFVPKIVPGHVVPGVRVRLAANRPLRLRVKAVLVFSRRGQRHEADLGRQSVRIHRWRRMRFAVPRKLRSSLRYGHRVRVRLRLEALPRSKKSSRCKRVTWKTLRVRVVKVFPHAVQRGRVR
jgi:YVTN family beta-propeller protein